MIPCLAPLTLVEHDVANYITFILFLLFAFIYFTLSTAEEVCHPLHPP